MYELALHDGAAGARFHAALERVADVAACTREQAAHALIAARGDAGLAITRLITNGPEEGGGGGGAPGRLSGGAPRRAGSARLSLGSSSEDEDELGMGLSQFFQKKRIHEDSSTEKNWRF